MDSGRHTTFEVRLQHILDNSVCSFVAVNEKVLNTMERTVLHPPGQLLHQSGISRPLCVHDLCVFRSLEVDIAHTSHNFILLKQTRLSVGYHFGKLLPLSILQDLKEFLADLLKMGSA